MVVGEGPCSHHIHKELTGVSHGHAEGLSAGGQFGGHGGQVAARRGSRGPHGRGRWGHHQHGGPVERGHPRGAVAWVRVMAAQAAGQRVVAAVAMLAGGRTRALAGRPLPRPPQAAAGRVVRFAATAARLRVPGLRVLLLPPVAATTIRATAPAAFTVLTAGAAPTIAVPQLWEAWVRIVGVWRRWVLVRESHGPRGGPWVRQRGQRVLVGGAAGTVVIMEGEVGHVCGGKPRTHEPGLSPAFAPLVSREIPSLGQADVLGKTATAVAARMGREIGQRSLTPSDPLCHPPEVVGRETLQRQAQRKPSLGRSQVTTSDGQMPSFSCFLSGLEEGAKFLFGNFLLSSLRG